MYRVCIYIDDINVSNSSLVSVKGPLTTTVIYLDTSAHEEPLPGHQLNLAFWAHF